MNESEFLFASTFLKASDSKGTPLERLNRFREASDTEALRAAAAEVFGVPADDVYDSAMADMADKLKSAVPDFKAFAPLFLKYDCTNIKTAIKCALRGISPDGLMFTCGTIPTDVIIDAANSSHFEKIPGAMGKAAEEAMAEYRKTGEVRAIDLIIDKACFADMNRLADEGGIDIIKTIVKIRTDGANLLASMRISASGMPSDVAVSLFKRAFLPGGEISERAFISDSEGALLMASEVASAARGVSASAVKRACAETSFAKAEKQLDDAVLALCEKYRFRPFGPEVAVRYIIIRETEIMNCRIIEAAMSSPQKEEILRERLRVAYV